MRKLTVVLTMTAMLAGCNTTDFSKWRWPKRTGDGTPVSVPTTAAPAAPKPASPAPTPAAPAPSPAATNPPIAPTPITALPPVEPAPAASAVPAVPMAPAPVPPVATEPNMVAAPAPVVNVPPKPADAGRAVMAYVNGEPLYMDQLNDLLVSGYGMAVAQQLVANELVRQEAARKSIVVTDAEVEAEHQRTMDAMFGTVNDANQRHRLLQQLLKRNNVSLVQWKMTMRRNALLARLAVNQVQVSEAEIKEAFDRRYERKVEVQHIQTATLADAQTVLRDLASGTEYTALVTKYSIGPSADQAGLLTPFGAKDTGTPPAMRQVALSMKTVGEVSDPIQIGTAFHIIKLLKTIEPKNVRYQDVRGGLAAEVGKRKAVALQQDILQILIRSGKMQYVNPVLKSQADQGL